jgi:hypothetical protein
MAKVLEKALKLLEDIKTTEMPQDVIDKRYNAISVAAEKIKNVGIQDQVFNALAEMDLILEGGEDEDPEESDKAIIAEENKKPKKKKADPDNPEGWSESLIKYLIYKFRVPGLHTAYFYFNKARIQLYKRMPGFYASIAIGAGTYVLTMRTINLLSWVVGAIMAAGYALTVAIKNTIIHYATHILQFNKNVFIGMFETAVAILQGMGALIDGAVNKGIDIFAVIKDNVKEAIPNLPDVSKLTPQTSVLAGLWNSAKEHVASIACKYLSVCFKYNLVK